MFRAFLSVLTTLSLATCATIPHRPLTPEASLRLEGKSLVQSRTPPADFAVVSVWQSSLLGVLGGALGGALGGLLMSSEGKRIVQEYEIADPSVALSEGLAERLRSARNMKVMSSSTLVPTDDVGELVKTVGEGDYLLEVKTFNWRLMNFPTDWDHYQVLYTARLRLIEVSTRQVVAESQCASKPGDKQPPPTQEQLLENQASLLKASLDQAVETCVERLNREVLRL